jgi:hypothetical protein
MAGHGRAQAARRLQDMLEAYRDVPPIKDERRLGHELPLPRCPHPIDAVRNAITESWSNGQTAGQINRLIRFPAD